MREIKAGQISNISQRLQVKCIQHSQGQEIQHEVVNGLLKELADPDNYTSYDESKKNDNKEYREILNQICKRQIIDYMNAGKEALLNTTWPEEGKIEGEHTLQTKAKYR